MQVGSDDDGYAVRLHCDWFMHYCSSNDEDHAPADDSPLYIFDGTRRLQTDIPKRAHFPTSIHAFMLIIVSTFLPFAALPHPFKCHYPPIAILCFPGTFGERSSSKAMLKEFSVPHFFAEDLFQYVGKKHRPPFR